MTATVMTGGTSGFGAAAAERLRRSGERRMILGARQPNSDERIALDLAQLDSVRSFATSVTERLAGESVSSLVLNAGTIRGDVVSRTVDGFETTFAVNYLAHYLLVRLLLPTLADGAVVVLTTSGTHDPAAGAGLTPPRHADPELLADPDRDPDRARRPRDAGEHAYTASKLCTILLARSLSAHPDVQAGGMTVVAFCPGQVFGTGLAQHLSLPLRSAWALLGTPIGFPLRRLKRDLNSRTAAGSALADLALGTTPPAGGDTYAALRGGRLTWPEPSVLARRDDLADALWRDSAIMVGLPA